MFILSHLCLLPISNPQYFAWNLVPQDLKNEVIYVYVCMCVYDGYWSRLWPQKVTAPIYIPFHIFFFKKREWHWHSLSRGGVYVFSPSSWEGLLIVPTDRMWSEWHHMTFKARPRKVMWIPAGSRPWEGQPGGSMCRGPAGLRPLMPGVMDREYIEP